MNFNLIGLNENHRYLVKFPKDMSSSEVHMYMEAFRIKFPGITFQYITEEVEVEEIEQCVGETNNNDNEQRED